jgi:UDP-3-O-[3-hydroxymyristoyl] glucosamine N-acyltransferase
MVWCAVISQKERSFMDKTPKYAFTEEKLGRLTRIIAARDIPEHGVKAGDLGGFIESELNLSDEGAAWVSGDARVGDNARIYGDALVTNHARVFGEAEISGKSIISNHAFISGCAAVFGEARVFGHASITGHVRIGGGSMIFGELQLSGNAWITGNPSLSGQLNQEKETLFTTNIME